MNSNQGAFSGVVRDYQILLSVRILVVRQSD